METDLRQGQRRLTQRVDLGERINRNRSLLRINSLDVITCCISRIYLYIHIRYKSPGGVCFARR